VAWAAPLQGPGVRLAAATDCNWPSDSQTRPLATGTRGKESVKRCSNMRSETVCMSWEYSGRRPVLGRQLPERRHGYTDDSGCIIPFLIWCAGSPHHPQNKPHMQLADKGPSLHEEMRAVQEVCPPPPFSLTVLVLSGVTAGSQRQ
jgi:hypothetical protein